MGKIESGGSQLLDTVGRSVESGLHTATDAIGVTNFQGQEAAAKASKEASDASMKMYEDQLKFQQDQYNDWKDIYGSIQEQEADYIARYTGEDIVAQQLGQTSQEYQTAQKQLSQALAQRGISGSGIEAAGLTQLYGQEASQKANIRASQDSIAEQSRLNFLGLGLGQGTQMLGTQASVAQTGISTQASIAGQQADLAGQLGTANIGSMGNLTGKVVGGVTKALLQ